MRISKSKFVAGIQCLKRLYFQVHQPELASGSDGVTEALLEEGRQVGLVAQQAFPGGITVTADHKHLDEAVRTTRELVSSAVPAIFEAMFEYGGVLVRTDVLERSSGQSFRLVEVKASTAMKPHYFYDTGGFRSTSARWQPRTSVGTIFECIVKVEAATKGKAMMPEQAVQRREKALRMAMERILPDFVKSCMEVGGPLIIHQDAFAADYDEYELLGMAIKFAGLYGKEISIIGKNRETLMATEAN